MSAENPDSFPSCSIRLGVWGGGDSNLPVERYHALSDATMDTLWESLEELLDAEGNPNYEVEYSVRRDPCSHA